MSAEVTKYRAYSDDELLQFVSDKRAYSPVIEELCQRIEQYNKGTSVAESADCCAECPVCEAAVKVEYDEGNELFTLEAIEP